MPCSVKVRMKQFGRGWSYTFATAHESAKTAADAFFAIRNDLIRVHDKGTFVKYISAKKIGTRQRHRIDVNLNPTAIGATFTADADEVSTAARIRLFTDSGQSRFLWLRGLADTAVKRTSDGADAPDGSWLNRLNTLIGVLGGQGANVAVRSLKEPTGDYRYIDVLSIAAQPATANKNSVFTLRETPPFGPGHRVIFTPPKKDVLLLPYRNGHKVLAGSVIDDTFAINAVYKGLEAGYQPDGMRVRWEDYDYVPITGGNWVAFGKLAVGPDDTPRGRDRSVSYRHS